MASEAANRSTGKGSLAARLAAAVLNLLLAVAALWLGMSIPSYFRSVSVLVLEAAATGTPTLLEQAAGELRSGRPSMATTLLQAVPPEARDLSGQEAVQEAARTLSERHPAYRWSGGPAPFYEQFLETAAYLREDETAVIPTLLPAENRSRLLAFLRQSPNQNVQTILETRKLGGWQRFYPVFSTSGHPLEATILATALLEQASAIPPPIKGAIMEAAVDSPAGEPSINELEAVYIAILTIGRHADWLQMKTLVGRMETVQQLLFCARVLQERPDRLPLLLAAMTNAGEPQQLVDYLNRHGDRGWEGVEVAAGLGRGALAALLAFDKPVYRPPALWKALPGLLQDSQQAFKGFAERTPGLAILARVLAFGMCGIFLVGILRIGILGLHPGGGHERRVLLNLDSMVGAALVTMLVWIIIEPGLMDFRPNEQGTLEIRLAQVVPETTLATTPSPMIDQVTILVLLLFFIGQLLVFVFGLLKIAEVRRQEVSPEVKLKLLDNEENLFDLGLYVGLGGTVGSLILVVLNIVDASLMAAYASTLFGIIFVALLKIGFLRPFRRQLILHKN
jgi:hypothetical protein